MTTTPPPAAPSDPVVREALRDGSLRLRAPECTMVLSRLRPGAVRVTIAGDDRGAFGALPFAELDAERARFGVPLELFVDAAATVRAAVDVSHGWSRWFTARRGALRRVTMLVHERSVAVAAAIARHLSNTGHVMTITSDAEVFRAAIARVAPEAADLPAHALLDAEPVAIERTVTPEGATRLATDGCTFLFTRARPGVLHVGIAGQDGGQLGALPLDETFASAAATRVGPAELFVDGARVTSVASEVTAQWLAWLGAHRALVRQTHILMPSDVVRLRIALAREAARATDTVWLYPDRDRFDGAFARACRAAS